MAAVVVFVASRHLRPLRHDGRRRPPGTRCAAPFTSTRTRSDGALDRDADRAARPRGPACSSRSSPTTATARARRSRPNTCTACCASTASKSARTTATTSRSACGTRRIRSAAMPTPWPRTSPGSADSASPRTRSRPRPELAWSDWTVPLDGIEWLNADSEWRDERPTALWRARSSATCRGRRGALASLLDRPGLALAKWDELAGKPASRRPGRPRRARRPRRGARRGADGACTCRPTRRRFGRSRSTCSVSEPPNGTASSDAARAARRDPRGAVSSRRSTPLRRRLRWTSGCGGRRDGAWVGGVLPDCGTARVLAARRFRAGASTRAAPRRRSRRRESVEHSGVLDACARHLPGRGRVSRAPRDAAVPWLVSNPIYRFRGVARRRASRVCQRSTLVQADLGGAVAHSRRVAGRPRRSSTSDDRRDVSTYRLGSRIRVSSPRSLRDSGRATPFTRGRRSGAAPRGRCGSPRSCASRQDGAPVEESRSISIAGGRRLAVPVAGLPRRPTGPGPCRQTPAPARSSSSSTRRTRSPAKQGSFTIQRRELRR